mgnify:CR=1 FL=1
MSSSPAVVVNKGGFLSALVKGICTVLVVLLLCGTALGLYGIRIADKYADAFTFGTFKALPDMIRALPEWRRLPPAVAEPLNDRRALDYRDRLTISTQLRRVQRAEASDWAVAEVEITNGGNEVVTWLGMRVLVEDQSAEHIERYCLLATPTACPQFEWAGPLAPGGKRRELIPINGIVGEARITVEVGDLRVWNGPLNPPSSAETPAAAMATAPWPDWLAD